MDWCRKRTKSITTTACARYTISSQYNQKEYTTPRPGSIHSVINAAMVSATRAVASQRSVRRISPEVSGARKRHKSRYLGISRPKKCLAVVCRFLCAQFYGQSPRNSTPRAREIYLRNRLFGNSKSPVSSVPSVVKGLDLCNPTSAL